MRVPILVSVITPVLNGEEHLEECIVSVLKQTYPYIEHIFADGGSSDRTLPLLEYFHQLYPDRIRYYSEPDSSGGEAANRTILKAKGEIIGFLGADDTYPVDAIQTAVDLFEDKVYFLFGSCNHMKNGKIFRTILARQPKKDELINGRFYLYGPAMFCRRELFDKIGLFSTSERYAAASDIDFLIRVSKKYHLYHTTKVLANFRTRIWLLNGKSWERSKAVLKAVYNITRDYGGKLTWSARVYSIACMIDFFRPILQPLYTLVDKYLMFRERKK
jgi:glycosyltransferase involved in cell wall biosynthesis